LSDHTQGIARQPDEQIVPVSRSDAQTWLEDLSATDPVQAAGEVREMLSTMNTVEMPAWRRLEVLEAFRESLSTISYRLTDRRTGSQLPLSESSRIEVALLSQIHNLLAMGYAWAAVSFSLSGTRYDKPSHAMAIHRAILYFGEVCCDAYRIYHPISKGVWLAMHELVRKAQQYKLLKFPVTDELNAFKPQTTITHAYKQILLTAALDPYKFAHGEIDEIHDQCNQLAVHAVLVAPPFVPSGKCQFLVNLDDDKPARVMQAQDQIEDPKQYFVLDTTQLVIALHDHFQSLDQRLEKTGYQKIKDEDRDRLKLLDSLIAAWGGKLIRKSMRLAIHDQRLVVHGFDGVTYFLNGQSELHCSGRTGSDIDNIVFRKQQLRADSGPADLGEWSCVDESANGVQLTKESTEPVANLIGRLIAVRRPTKQKDAWDVGVVRWMRSEQTNKISIGVYKFGPIAEAVSIQDVTTRSNKNLDQPLSLAILIKILDGNKTDSSLIVPKDVSKLRHHFVMKTADESLLIQPTKIRLATNDLDWVDFDVVQVLTEQNTDAKAGIRQKGAA
jgi:hypothetical protein